MDPSNEPVQKTDSPTAGMVSEMQTEQQPINPMNEPSSGNGKKVAIGVAALIAVIAIGFGAFVLGSSQANESSSEVAAEEQTEEAEVIQEASNTFQFATNNFGYNLAEDGELVRIFEAQANEKIIAISSDRKTAYATVQTEQSNIPEKLVSIVDGVRADIIDLNTDGDITVGDLSPDGTKFAYFKGINDSGLSYTVGSIDIASGELSDGYEMILDASQRPTLIFNTKWVSNTKLISTENSCFQCDGPVLPKIHLVDPQTGEIELLSDLTELKDSNLSAGNITLSKDLKTAYILTDNNNSLGGNATTVSESTATIYSIDTASGDTKEVAEIKGSFLTISGISSDQSQLLLNELKPKTDASESDADFYQDPAILTVAIASGRLSPIPVSVSQFDDDFSNITGIAFNSEENILYFAVRSTPSTESNPNEQRTVLYSLPIEGGEENSVSTLFDMKEEGFINIIELNAL